jgi:hypothetical protein
MINENKFLSVKIFEQSYDLLLHSKKTQNDIIIWDTSEMSLPIPTVL